MLDLICAELSKEVYRYPKDYIWDSEHKILALCGTRDVDDWAVNIKILNKSKNIHRGFKNRAIKILSEIKNFVNQEDEVTLGGHSLGGVAATILAVLMIEQGYYVNNLITFGSPKPGGIGFRNRYYKNSLDIREFRHYRYVHGNDIVPRVPPWLLGYCHVCPELHLQDVTPGVIDSIEDHNIDNYIKGLISANG